MATQEKALRDRPDLPFRIIHLADHSADPPFSRSLCGKTRDRPLDASVRGERCVVCRAMSMLRGGVWS